MTTRLRVRACAAILYASMAPTIDPQLLALFDKLVATRPGVERKGATMTLLRKTAELAGWFAQSHEYVAGLPPKATARAKKTAAVTNKRATAKKV